MANKFLTVFEALGHYLKEIFGDSTTESHINAGIAVVTPIVSAVVELAGGPGASAAVVAGIAQLKSDYATLCAVVQGTVDVPNGTFFVSALVSSLSDNLSAILSDVGIKNGANFNKISAYVQFFLSEVKAIASQFAAQRPATALPQPVAPAAAPTAPAPVPPVLKI